MLKPQEIYINEEPLKRKDDEYELKLLAISIKSNGLIEPLTVRIDETGKYQLVTGFRRLRAANMAGLRRVPCILKKIDRPTAALMGALGNLQHKNPHFLEEAALLCDLIYKYGFSYSEVSARLGIPQNELASNIGLLKLDPYLREKLYNADLEKRYAKALLKLPASSRDDALDMIISENMNPKEAEEYIKKRLNPEKEPKGQPQRKMAIGDIRLFSNSLSKLVLTLQTAGVRAIMRKSETDRYYEFHIKITKEASPDIPAEQLKIC